MNQFSLRILLIVVSIVAVFLALGRSYVFDGEFDELHGVVHRAQQLPPLFAVVTALVGALHTPGMRVRTAMVIGSFTSLLVAAALWIEIGEGLRSVNYWNWWNDLPAFLYMVGMHTIFGGAVGGCIAFLSRHVRIEIDYLRGRR